MNWDANSSKNWVWNTRNWRNSVSSKKSWRSLGSSRKSWNAVATSSRNYVLRRNSKSWDGCRKNLAWRVVKNWKKRVLSKKTECWNCLELRFLRWSSWKRTDA